MKSICQICVSHSCIIISIVNIQYSENRNGFALFLFFCFSNMQKGDDSDDLLILQKLLILILVKNITLWYNLPVRWTKRIFCCSHRLADYLSISFPGL